MVQMCLLCAWSVFGGIFWTMHGGTSAFLNRYDLSGSSNNPNGLMIFFWMLLVGREFDGRPSPRQSWKMHIRHDGGRSHEFD